VIKLEDRTYTEHELYEAILYEFKINRKIKGMCRDLNNFDIMWDQYSIGFEVFKVLSKPHRLEKLKNIKILRTAIKNTTIDVYRKVLKPHKQKKILDIDEKFDEEIVELFKEMKFNDFEKRFTYYMLNGGRLNILKLDRISNIKNNHLNKNKKLYYLEKLNLKMLFFYINMIEKKDKIKNLICMMDFEDREIDFIMKKIYDDNIQINIPERIKLGDEIFKKLWRWIINERDQI
jgi:hypothetical protein